MTRLTIILSAVLALVLSITVFRITYQVDALEKELNALNQDILSEQETIHILNAEWSYLNDPTRLYDLAKRYLNLEEMRGEQLIKMEMLNDQLGEPAPKSDAQPVNLER
jgi:cell division protein FtsL